MERRPYALMTSESFIIVSVFIFLLYSLLQTQDLRVGQANEPCIGVILQNELLTYL